MTHTTPLTTTRSAAPPEEAPVRPDGARFEAPLHTVPYPLSDCRAACLETRDLIEDEDSFRF